MSGGANVLHSSSPSSASKHTAAISTAASHTAAGTCNHSHRLTNCTPRLRNFQAVRRSVGAAVSVKAPQ